MSGAWLRKKDTPSLAGRAPSFDHVLGDARLRRLQTPSLSSRRGCVAHPKADSPMLVRRINTRSSVSICGRPPNGRDFTASSSESRPYANARESRAGMIVRTAGLTETSDTVG